MSVAAWNGRPNTYNNEDASFPLPVRAPRVNLAGFLEIVPCLHLFVLRVKCWPTSANAR